ncbi:hypothetical protein DXA95_16230 [Odoribacter sp. OF09-27XD]|jgi:hypothetical protein|nr:hypothetical protein [Odoribacter sp. OF09-27XD]RHV89192.1 hypothetical protein DXA95_16230 [Odoribacter sp. OF09-27XD]
MNTKTTKEENIVNELGDYLSFISSIEGYTDLTPEQSEFYKAADICFEILKRTSVISKIVIERPEELREAWEDSPEFDYMSKFAISTCEIADEVIRKIRE